DGIPFAPLGAVCSAQNQRVVLAAIGALSQVLSALRWLQRDSRQERRTIRVASGNRLQLLQVCKPRIGVVEAFAQYGIVNLPHACNVRGYRSFTAWRPSLYRVEQLEELPESLPGARRRAPVRKRPQFPPAGSEFVHGRASGHVSHSGKQKKQPEPAHLIARV